MEKLTLQQLVVYLPYGLSLRDKSGDIWHMQIDPILPFEITIKGVLDKNMTPILYSISCLTKEITHKGETFVPIVELAKIAFPTNLEWKHYEGKRAILDTKRIRYVFIYDDGFHMWFQYLNSTKQEGVGVVSNQHKLFQKLAEWHINFLNIPDNLFIDKSTLK